MIKKETKRTVNTFVKGFVLGGAAVLGSIFLLLGLVLGAQYLVEVLGVPIMAIAIIFNVIIVGGAFGGFMIFYDKTLRKPRR